MNKLNDEINLVDIGCSDSLQSQWKFIERKLKYIGFEPNKEECERVSKLPNNFSTCLFLPYAIAGFSGTTNIHITESFYCTSLLEPDYEWLDRFEFADFFKLKKIEAIDVRSLDEIHALKEVDIDIMKIDSQGLELEILKSASRGLKQAIYVETESGFHPNYINESTQSEIDNFMRQNGFILFDILPRRMPLKNHFKDYGRPNAQVLWCECKWIRDLITASKKNRFSELRINRAKALKYLMILAVNGIYDYGLEYAKIFHKHKLIDDNELEELSHIDTWRFVDLNETTGTKNIDSSISFKFKLLFKKALYKNIQLSSRLLNFFS